MKEYRRLDDSITMRLNRTNAQFRDKDRLAPSSGGKMSQTVQDQACLYVWKELVGESGRFLVFRHELNFVFLGLLLARPLCLLRICICPSL